MHNCKALLTKYDTEDFAYHHYRYHYGIPELKKASLAQALKRLREKGFIEKATEKNEGKIF